VTGIFQINFILKKKYLKILLTIQNGNLVHFVLGISVTLMNYFTIEVMWIHPLVFAPMTTLVHIH